MKKFICAAAVLAVGISSAVSFGGCKSGEAYVQFTLSEDGTYYIVSGVSGDKRGLTSYDVPATYSAEDGGELLPVKEIGYEAFFQCFNLTDVTLPNTVTKIGLRAFAGCSFSEFTIPDSVSFIDSAAFGNCSNLSEITIPAGVTALGPQAFAFCSSLEKVYLNANITVLEYRTFYNNYAAVGGNVFSDTKLKEIYLPATLEKIQLEAWSGNFFLSDIYYEGTEQQWNEIYFFEMVEKDGDESGYEEKKYSMSEALGSNGTIHYNVEF